MATSVAAALNAGLEEKGKLLTCQRIGCDAKYTEDDNPEGCCRYHPGAPLFHDGRKEWSCCKARSHDFGEFMSLPGCTVGRHSQDKPQKPAPSPNNNPVAKPIEPGFKIQGSGTAVKIQGSGSASSAASSDLDAAKANCPRCKQGFFCSDHQGPPAIKVAGVMAQTAKPKPKVAEVGPDVEQTCKNKGCGLKYKENENHNNACKYHPGPPLFHDRKKGWKCCDVHVDDFDKFLSIPPCTTGRHNANAEG